MRARLTAAILDSSLKGKLKKVLADI